MSSSWCHHATMQVGARSFLCPKTIPKGSKTPTSHILFIYSRPLNHLVCGLKGFFNALLIKQRSSTIFQRPYKVINDHNIFIKSARTIKPSNVGETTSRDFFRASSSSKGLQPPQPHKETTSGR